MFSLTQLLNTQDALLELGSSMILVDISQRIDAAKCMGICVLTADFVGTSLVLGLFKNLANVENGSMLCSIWTYVGCR